MITVMESARTALLGMNNERGFSLVEVVIAAALLAGALMATAQLSNSLRSSSLSSSSNSQVESVRRRLIATVLNDKAWQVTVANNPDMKCLASPSVSCAANPPAPFNLFDGIKAPVSETLKATKGFTADGVECSTFDAKAATKECYYRYDLTWSAICAGGCNQPMVRVAGTLRVATNATIKVNPDLYSIRDLIRAAQ